MARMVSDDGEWAGAMHLSLLRNAGWPLQHLSKGVKLEPLQIAAANLLLGT